jgi:hypothetical protein
MRKSICRNVPMLPFRMSRTYDYSTSPWSTGYIDYGRGRSGDSHRGYLGEVFENFKKGNQRGCLAIFQGGQS